MFKLFNKKRKKSVINNKTDKLNNNDISLVLGYGEITKSKYVSSKDGIHGDTVLIIKNKKDDFESKGLYYILKENEIDKYDKVYFIGEDVEESRIERTIKLLKNKNTNFYFLDFNKGYVTVKEELNKINKEIFYDYSVRTGKKCLLVLDLPFILGKTNFYEEIERIAYLNNSNCTTIATLTAESDYYLQKMIWKSSHIIKEDDKDGNLIYVRDIFNSEKLVEKKDVYETENI